MDELFTVGHSTRTLEELLDLLKESNIETIADVRRWPISTRFPHLSRAPLAAALESAGLAYIFLGATLGGYRSGGYEAHMTTQAFRDGLAELENLARARRMAVL